jgi:hypothetical protein
MALNDITIYDEGAFGYPGEITYKVAASATLIYPGEPVAKALGAYVVTPSATTEPTVADGDLMCGIAASTSTNTASAVGYVNVIKLDPRVTYLCAPTTAASWDTQAEYDLLVGDRVVLALSSGTYTVGATDNAAYGLVVEPLDISKYPGKVRFSIRPAATYLGFATGLT